MEGANYETPDWLPLFCRAQLHSKNSANPPAAELLQNLQATQGNSWAPAVLLSTTLPQQLLAIVFNSVMGSTYQFVNSRLTWTLCAPHTPMSTTSSRRQFNTVIARTRQQCIILVRWVKHMRRILMNHKVLNKSCVARFKQILDTSSKSIERHNLNISAPRHQQYQSLDLRTWPGHWTIMHTQTLIALTSWSVALGRHPRTRVPIWNMHPLQRPLRKRTSFWKKRLRLVMTQQAFGIWGRTAFLGTFNKTDLLKPHLQRKGWCPEDREWYLHVYGFSPSSLPSVGPLPAATRL